MGKPFSVRDADVDDKRVFVRFDLNVPLLALQELERGAAARRESSQEELPGVAAIPEA